MTLFSMEDHPQMGPVWEGWPGWFCSPDGPGKTIPKAHSKRVRQGLHPLGQELGPEGSTCKTCEHMRRIRYKAGKYNKCDKAKWTHGPATDLKLRWRGCALFKGDR